MRILILVAVYVISFSCSDTVSQKEKDLIKYDYLHPFIVKDGEYKKGILDLDTNELVYYYKVDNMNSVLNDIDKKANSEGWIKNNNTYEKKIFIYNNLHEKVKVVVKKEGQLIKFIIN